MKKIVFSLLMVLAVPVFAHNGNNGWVTIKGFDLWSSTYTDSQIRIIISGDTYYNPAGCNAAMVDSYMVSTAQPESHQNRMFSMLLAATMAGKAVSIRLDTNYCENNRPRIITVMLQ